MRIEVIWTGEELLDGRVEESNTGLVASFCISRGYQLQRVQIVGDSLDSGAAALQCALESADIVLLAGGLGPTDDDRTRDLVARLSGEEFLHDEAAAARIEARYAKHGRRLQPSTMKQALLPASAEHIINPVGIADGWRQRVAGKTLVVLPGVPRELAAMLEPALSPLLPELSLPVRNFMLYGISEARSVELLHESLAGLDLDIRWCVKSPLIQLSLVGGGAAAPDLRERLSGALGGHLLPEGADNIAQLVLNDFKSAGATLATAESCTGGAISSAITDLGGSSAVFMQGWCTYSNNSKTKELGVAPELIAAHGAVSEEVARAMAEGARQRADTTWAVSTTGIAGPTGGSATKPVGTVWVGVAGPGVSVAARFYYPGRARLLFKVHVTAAALWLLHQVSQAKPQGELTHSNLEDLRVQQTGS